MENNNPIHNLEQAIKPEYFKELTTSVKAVFSKTHISAEEKYISYKRLAKGTSILAIKVCQGDDADAQNFMYVFCELSRDEKPICNVCIRATGKSAIKTKVLAPLLTTDFEMFFQKVEQELRERKLNALETSIRLPLDYEPKREDEKSTRRIRRFFIKK